VGDAVAFDAARGLVQVNARNKFSVGDKLEIIHPTGNFDVQITRMENAEGEEVPAALGSGHTVWLDLPESCLGAFVARYLEQPIRPLL
jgi:putative protease